MQAACADRFVELLRPPKLHRHCTGQLVVSVLGVVGLMAENFRIALPPASALWAPPGLAHEGFIGPNSKSLYLHITPKWAAELPDEPFRIMLTPMMMEMVRHFTQIRKPFAVNSHTGRLARVLLEEIKLAPQLPLNFAPLPANPQLFLVAEKIVEHSSFGWTVSQWANFVGMSERNFSRLVVRETGMSFGQWRLRLLMLTATRLILEGHTSESVAQTLGYETPSAFIMAFKRVFGMTPGRYRSEAFVTHSHPLD